MTLQISHKYKCIFIHVPKTGGTSVEKTSLFDDQRERIQGYVGGHTTAIKFRKEYPEEFNSYFKFAFVRNPWDKLVSAFFYLSQHSFVNRLEVEFKEKYIVKYNNNFHAFCCESLNEETINKTVLLKPQYTFLCDEQDNIIVDFVGKLENLEQDFKLVAEKIKFSEHLTEHQRHSKHDYYTSYYTEKTKKIVERVYRKDIDLFGYKYNQDWMQNYIGFWYKRAKNKAVSIRKVLK